MSIGQDLKMELSDAVLCKLIISPKIHKLGILVFSISECDCVFYKIFNSVSLSEWVFIESDTVLIRKNEGTRASGHKGVAICKSNRYHQTDRPVVFSLSFPPKTARKQIGKI